MPHSSKLVEEAVNEIATLPGIGKKTALRLALFLLRVDRKRTEQLTAALQKLRTEIQYCRHCHHIADEPVCGICANPHRDRSIICIVENIQDVLADR
ncbi:MAG: recombination protein RecR, partial [Bacteroidota bacterium]